MSRLVWIRLAENIFVTKLELQLKLQTVTYSSWVIVPTCVQMDLYLISEIWLYRGEVSVGKKISQKELSAAKFVDYCKFIEWTVTAVLSMKQTASSATPSNALHKNGRSRQADRFLQKLSAGRPVHWTVSNSNESISSYQCRSTSY